MKRSAKVAIIVAVCLIVIGLLVGAAVTFFQSRSRGWQNPFEGGFLNTISGIESSEYTKRTETFSAADVKGLELTTISRDVKFVVGDSGEYRITCWENEDRWFEIELDGRALKVREKHRSLALPDSHVADEYRTLLVEVPENCVPGAIATVSGDVYLPALKIDGGMTVATTSGDIKIDVGFELGGDMSLSTSSGDLIVKGSFEGDFDLSTTSGGLRFSGEAASFKAESVSGDMDLSGSVFAGRTDITTTSGEVIARGLSVGSLKVHTTSGEVTISGLVSGEIDVDTTSGDVRLTLADPDSFKYDLKSTSGDHVSPYGTPSGALCRVRTTSGDIVID